MSRRDTRQPWKIWQELGDKFEQNIYDIIIQKMYMLLEEVFNILKKLIFREFKNKIKRLYYIQNGS